MPGESILTGTEEGLWGPEKESHAVHLRMGHLAGVKDLEDSYISRKFIRGLVDGGWCEVDLSSQFKGELVIGELEGRRTFKCHGYSILHARTVGYSHNEGEGVDLST